MTALKIDPDGTMQPVEITGETIEQQNDSIYEHLGGYFDTVRLSGDAIMLVDDEGLLKGLPMNPAAMMVASYPMLVGTALIVGLMPTEDGDVFTDCPQRFIRFAESIQQEGGEAECVNGQKRMKTVSAHQSGSAGRRWSTGS